MRYLLALLLISTTVQAEAPEMHVHAWCEGDKIMLKLYATKKGVFTLAIPALMCGQGV